MRRLAIVQDLINAYEDHSRTDFDAHLARLEQMLRYAGPPPLASDTPEEAARKSLEVMHRLDQHRP